MFFLLQKISTSSYPAIIAFALVLPACAYAESSFRSTSAQKHLPADFQGVWLFANEENSKCTNPDFEKRENDELIRISSSSVEEWESGGHVLSVHKVPIGPENRRTVVLNLARSGEGMSWTTKEIWHVEKIDGRKVLVMTTLKSFDSRDDNGKPMRGTPETHLPSVQIYLECT
jgi:hypothetical protein